MSYYIGRISRAEANLHISEFHRHHGPVRASFFQIGAFRKTQAPELTELTEFVGCVVVGRPNARAICDRFTSEVTRLCVRAGHFNVCSMLLGAAWRACKAMGDQRLISYVRHDESGSCYRASSWSPCAITKARKWNSERRKQTSLPGVLLESTESVPRVRWEIHRDKRAQMNAEIVLPAIP